VQQSKETIDLYQKDLAALQAQRQQIADEVQGSWGDVVNKTKEVTINPKKSDIYLSLFGVAWMPFYLVKAGGVVVEAAAFGAD
jgi:hypothetical protein